MFTIRKPNSDKWYLMYPNGLLVEITGNVRSFEGKRGAGAHRLGTPHYAVWGRLVETNRAVRRVLGMNEDAVV